MNQGEALNTLTFTELKGRTLVSLSHGLCLLKEIRDGAIASGMNEGIEMQLRPGSIPNWKLAI